MPRVLVVGAGISGLACAHRLAANGVDVEVLEGDSAPGGVMQSRVADGFLVETGPNSFQSNDEILSLVHDVGLDGELLRADARMKRYVWFRDALVPAPLGPGALLGTKLLSMRAKLRLLREPWAPRNPAGRDESIREFVTRRLGPEVHDVLVAPLVGGIFAGDTSRLAIASVFPLLAELEEKHGSLLRGFVRLAKERRAAVRAAGRPSPKKSLCSFRRGVGALPERLAERLGARLHLGCGVEAIHCTADGFVVSASKRGSSREISASSVVLAGSAKRTAQMLRTLAPTSPDPPAIASAASALAHVEMPPLASVCVAYRVANVPRPLDGFGFLVPRGAGVRLLGCIWSSSLFPGRAPKGWALLTCFAGGATDPAVRDLRDDALVDLVRTDLGRVLGVREAPRIVALHRYAEAIPQYTLGHGERTAELRRAAVRVPGLFLAGNYLAGVSVGDCVRQSTTLAAEIARDGAHARR